jgi:hypothetical protein
LTKLECLIGLMSSNWFYSIKYRIYFLKTNSANIILSAFGVTILALRQYIFDIRNLIKIIDRAFIEDR